MGRVHAATGAGTWLAGCATVAAVAAPPSPHTSVVGTVVCAFGALLPDWDMPTSSVSRALGPVTALPARALAWAGRRLYYATRTKYCPDTKSTRQGHRTITHTLWFAVIATAVAGMLAAVAGPVVLALLVWWAATTTVRTLLPWKMRTVSWRTGPGRYARVPVAALAGAAIATVQYAWWPAQAGWWPAAAVGAGVLLHLAGDCLTMNGCPLLAGIAPVRGARWHPVRLPTRMRLRSGGTPTRTVTAPNGRTVTAPVPWHERPRRDLIEPLIGVLFVLVGAVSAVSLIATPA